MNRTGFFLACLLLPLLLAAHAPDNSYLYLTVLKNTVYGRIELNAEDINRAIGSSLPSDLSVADVNGVLPRVHRYLAERVRIAGPENYTFDWREPEILKLEEMGQDVVRFHFGLAGMTYRPDALDISYNVVFDQYERHRGGLLIDHNWREGVIANETQFTAVFEPGRTDYTLDLTGGSVWTGFVALLRLGVYHIWIGLDHILFIIALVLPAVVWRRREEREFLNTSVWHPVERFRPAFLYIIKVITFFTIAHSITLALATFRIVDLPSRYVESVIAFSIGLAALHNIWPIFRGREWVIAFVFGLFHGFGFASVLGEKGLSGDYLAYSLLGFNLGVELGQLAIIVVAFPLLFLVRKLPVYSWFIKLGSALLIVIALYWTVERLFEVDIPVVSLFLNIFGLPAVE